MPGELNIKITRPFYFDFNGGTFYIENIEQWNKLITRATTMSGWRSTSDEIKTCFLDAKEDPTRTGRFGLYKEYTGPRRLLDYLTPTSLTEHV